MSLPAAPVDPFAVRGRVCLFLAFSAAIIIVRRLVREGWIRYRWDGRPARKP
jgi:hypothetical protein